MERKSKEESVKWRNTGTGTFRLANRKIIKPNEVFHAKPSQVPESFRDTLKCYEELPGDENKNLKDVTSKGSFKIEVKTPGWFNVVSDQGKVMNDRALRAADAEELKEQLEGEG